MQIRGRLRAFVGAIPRAAVRRESHRFLAATKNCRETQLRVLQRLLAINADSDFSRRHQFQHVRTVSQFRHHIPVTDYEYVRPAIDRVRNGETSALLGSRNPLLMFSLTSGTTSESKFIPITRQFLKDYRRGWQVWGIRTLDDHRAVNSRNIVQLSSNYDRYRTPGGTPCGNISGLVVAMQKRIVQSMYTVPPIVSRIEDTDAKQYCTLRLAVADANVGMVTTANPSTLIHLARLTERVRDTLIRDIANGTLSDDYAIPSSIRKSLAPRIRRRNPQRARQLEAIINRTGHLHPSDFWPGLDVVAVWMGGSAGAYLSTLKTYYGESAVRDHGLSASEGRMTIPIADGQSAGILDLTSHFFEFIPEEEHESTEPTLLQAHELEPGRNYFILLTTSSGLYRYNICDVVRCCGFYNTTPMLEFLHKGSHIASVTGEKVSESQVVAAVRTVADTMQLQLRHFTICPVWGDPPSYQLLVESRDLGSDDIGGALAHNVDEQLKQLNCEYREKRETKRLGPLSLIPLPTGTWNHFSEQRQRGLGGTMEQYKHPCLVPDLAFSSRLMMEIKARHGSDAVPDPNRDRRAA